MERGSICLKFTRVSFNLYEIHCLKVCERDKILFYINKLLTIYMRYIVNVSNTEFKPAYQLIKNAINTYFNTHFSDSL